MVELWYNHLMNERVLKFPGFVDVHVHFRDPGVPEAENTASGLRAARRGGFAAVVTMPNTTPALDTPEAIASHQARGENGVALLTSACITRGRLGREVADLEQLAEVGAAFFTDDGSYVADEKVMREAMERVAALNMVVCQHAMTKTDGVIRDCPLARKLGLPIIPSAVETDAIRRDLALCRETGCRPRLVFRLSHFGHSKCLILVARQQSSQHRPAWCNETFMHRYQFSFEIQLNT